MENSRQTNYQNTTEMIKLNKEIQTLRNDPTMSDIKNKFVDELNSTIKKNGEIILDQESKIKLLEEEINEQFIFFNNGYEKYDVQIQELKNVITNLNLELKEKDKQIEESTENIINLESVLDGNTSKISKPILNAQIDTETINEKLLNNQKADIRNLEAQIANLEKKIKEKSEMVVPDLAPDYTSNEEEILLLNKEIHKLESKLDANVEKYSKLLLKKESEFEKYKSEKEALLSNEKKEIKDLRNQIEILSEALHKLKKAPPLDQEKMNELETEIIKHRFEQRDYEECIDNLTLQLKQSQDQINLVKDDCKLKLSSQESLYDIEVKKLQQEIDTYVGKLRELQINHISGNQAGNPTGGLIKILSKLNNSFDKKSPRDMEIEGLRNIIESLEASLEMMEVTHKKETANFEAEMNELILNTRRADILLAHTRSTSESKMEIQVANSSQREDVLTKKKFPETKTD